jgi:hypothetical protein
MDLEEAVDSVNRALLVSLEQVAKKSGAGNPSIQVERIDRVVQGIHLDTELIFTSTGRPAMAQ